MRSQEGRGLQEDKTLPHSPFAGQFFQITFDIAFYQFSPFYGTMHHNSPGALGWRRGRGGAGVRRTAGGTQDFPLYKYFSDAFLLNLRGGGAEVGHSLVQKLVNLHAQPLLICTHAQPHLISLLNLSSFFYLLPYFYDNLLLLQLL